MRVGVAVLVTLLASTSAAQEKIDEAMIARIKAEGFQRSKVMETAVALSDLYGHATVEETWVGRRAPKTAFDAKGCSACGGTGYRGRVALIEMLDCDEAVLSAVAHGAPAAEIEAIAGRSGYAPMLQDGCDKAERGLTSFSEVMLAMGA